MSMVMLCTHGTLCSKLSNVAILITIATESNMSWQEEIAWAFFSETLTFLDEEINPIKWGVLHMS